MKAPQDNQHPPLPLGVFVSMMAHAFDVFSTAYKWQCSVASSLVYMCANKAGLVPEFAVTFITEKEGHYFIVIEDHYIDLTFRQYYEDSKWPIFVEKGHPEMEEIYSGLRILKDKQAKEVVKAMIEDGRIEGFKPLLDSVYRTIKELREGQ